MVIYGFVGNDAVGRQNKCQENMTDIARLKQTLFPMDRDFMAVFEIESTYKTG